MTLIDWGGEFLQGGQKTLLGPMSYKNILFLKMSKDNLIITGKSQRNTVVYETELSLPLQT